MKAWVRDDKTGLVVWVEELPDDIPPWEATILAFRCARYIARPKKFSPNITVALFTTPC